MPSAEIIAIGTELLLGEIQDTNTRYIARRLRDSGVDVYRTTIIGDNTQRIAHAIIESLERAQIIITTGGLGPTIDDPTREAVAAALNVSLVFRQELWDQILARFSRFGRQATENNRRQAYIPSCAKAIENPVGTAPAFYAETKDNRIIISVPGVPREMEHLLEHIVLPFLKEKYQLRGTIKARVLHLAGVGESQVDEWIGDYETHSNPTVGLLAHAGQTDVRITAKADTIETADQLLEEMTKNLLSRLGDNVYGIDNITLEDVIAERIKSHEWKLSVLEAGFGKTLISRLSNIVADENRLFFLAETTGLEELNHKLEQDFKQMDDTVILAASLIPGSEKQTVNMIVKSPVGTYVTTKSYGGPPSMGNTWAVNSVLDFLRRNL